METVAELLKVNSVCSSWVESVYEAQNFAFGRIKSILCEKVSELPLPNVVVSVGIEKVERSGEVFLQSVRQLRPQRLHLSFCVKNSAPHVQELRFCLTVEKLAQVTASPYVVVRSLGDE